MSKRILFDTNALLDFGATQEERPRHDSVKRLIEKCVKDDIVMCTSMGSLKDVYYVLRRLGRSHREACFVVDVLSRLFDCLPLELRHSVHAIASGEPDYEDGLIRAHAELDGMDAIIIHDKKAFAKSSVPRLTADAALASI